jgi:hypothetical protein
MPAIIFSIVAIVIGLCSLLYHDVRFPPEGRAYLKALNRSRIGIKNGTADQSEGQLVGHMTAR